MELTLAVDGHENAFEAEDLSLNSEEVKPNKTNLRHRRPLLYCRFLPGFLFSRLRQPLIKTGQRDKCTVFSRSSTDSKTTPFFEELVLSLLVLSHK